MAVVEKLGMTTATVVNGVMLLWNALIGWFVAFVLPPTLHYSCCESCPRTTALGTASSSIGVESQNDGKEIDNEVSVPGRNLDPVLVEEWASAVWWSLKLDVSDSLCSKELKHILFADDPEINQNQTYNILLPFASILYRWLQINWFITHTQRILQFKVGSTYKHVTVSHGFV